MAAIDFLFKVAMPWSISDWAVCWSRTAVLICPSLGPNLTFPASSACATAPQPLDHRLSFGIERIGINGVDDRGIDRNFILLIELHLVPDILGRIGIAGLFTVANTA